MIAFLGPARGLADAKRLVNLSLCRLGDSGFTDMQRVLIIATEGRGNALLPIQDAGATGSSFRSARAAAVGVE